MMNGTIRVESKNDSCSNVAQIQSELSLSILIGIDYSTLLLYKLNA